MDVISSRPSRSVSGRPTGSGNIPAQEQATIGRADAEFTIRFEAPYGEAHVIVDVVGWYE